MEPLGIGAAFLFFVFAIKCFPALRRMECFWCEKTTKHKVTKEGAVTQFRCTRCGTVVEHTKEI